jgi:hypothetical protein
MDKFELLTQEQTAIQLQGQNKYLELMKILYIDLYL